MRNDMWLFLALALSAPAWGSELEKSAVDQLDERVTELEAASALQKTQLSGVLINRFEFFKTEYGLPGEVRNKDILQPFSIYAALNLDFDVTERLKVYTTLAMSKFWNTDGGRNETPGAWQASEAGSYGLRGSTPMFDRAFLSYSFDFPLTFSIGRMPTNNGEPANQLDGLARQGTYPRFAYNAIFDGLALAYDFSRLLPDGNLLESRAFYTPTINISNTDRTRQLKDGPFKIASNTPSFAFLTEYDNTRLTPVADKLSLYYMFYNYDDFYNEGSNDADPPLNPIDSAIAHTLYFGLESIGGIGLNASVSALYYRTTEQALNATEGTTFWSRSYLINVNQKLDFLHKGTVFGVERIKTDPEFYLDEWTRLEVIPFYQTPASRGWHVYGTAPVAEKLRLRVGWYQLHSDPYETVVFKSQDVTDSYSLYAQLRVDF